MSAPPSFVDSRSTLERLFEPQWAGGWTLARYVWVFAALWEHAWRVMAIEDAYCARDMVYVNSIYKVASYVECTPTMGYGLWFGTMVGIACVAFGGRVAKPGLVLWAVCAWTLMGHESLMIKAHDRLLTWIAVGMLLGPIGERNLTRKYRSPAGRIWLLMTMAGIYGTTGIEKYWHEPSWTADGQVLGYHFLHHHFGQMPIGIWLSDKFWLLWPATVITVLWEASFPFLILFKRLNPIVLLIGAFFHVTLLATMSVGPFAAVAMSTYPVLLHPELAREGYGRFLKWKADRA